MIQALLGKKLGQSQMFNSNGMQIPVTLMQVGPCVVVQVRKKKKDGYNALQLGFGTANTKKINKPAMGHYKKTGKIQKDFPEFLGEVEFVEIEVKEGEKKISFEPGSVIYAHQIFKVDDKVSVTGMSKGKGFAGVMKRHGFKGGPRTHGQSDRERAPGSIGQTTTPGRVYKGKKMAGRMGTERKTIQGLRVVTINQKKNQLIVKGLVPGNIGSSVIIQKQ